MHDGAGIEGPAGRHRSARRRPSVGVGRRSVGSSVGRTRRGSGARRSAAGARDRRRPWPPVVVAAGGQGQRQEQDGADRGAACASWSDQSRLRGRLRRRAPGRGRRAPGVRRRRPRRWPRPPASSSPDRMSPAAKMPGHGGGEVGRGQPVDPLVARHVAAGEHEAVLVAGQLAAAASRSAARRRAAGTARAPPCVVRSPVLVSSRHSHSSWPSPPPSTTRVQGSTSIRSL